MLFSHIHLPLCNFLSKMISVSLAFLLLLVIRWMLGFTYRLCNYLTSSKNHPANSALKLINHGSLAPSLARTQCTATRKITTSGYFKII